MIKSLLMMRELNPEVRIKRMAQKISRRLAGQKTRKKFERQLNSLEKPVYKIPTNINQ